MNRVLDFKKGDIAVKVIEKHSNLAKIIDLSLENIDEWCKEVRIASVGKKYITTIKGEKFLVDDDYREKYTCGGIDFKLYTDFKLYKSKNDVIEEIKREKIKSDIMKLISEDEEEKISTHILEKIHSLLIN